MKRRWDSLTIIKLVDVSLETFANQVFNGRDFSDIPEAERILILRSIRAEIEDRLTALIDERESRKLAAYAQIEKQREES
jgi:hypothetical protein